MLPELETKEQFIAWLESKEPGDLLRVRVSY